jgi:hypothetical protein
MAATTHSRRQRCRHIQAVAAVPVEEREVVALNWTRSCWSGCIATYPQMQTSPCVAGLCTPITRSSRRYPTPCSAQQHSERRCGSSLGSMSVRRWACREWQGVGALFVPSPSTSTRMSEAHCLYSCITFHHQLGVPRAPGV